MKNTKDSFVVYNMKEQKQPFVNISIHECAYTKLKAMSKRTNTKMAPLIDMMFDFCEERLEVR